jgi:predicted MFS family arabinose efflux permease
MPISTGRSGLTIGVVALCGLVVSLSQTLVVPLLPHLPDLLQTTPATASWLVTSTLVAAAVCAPVLGRLGDMYGKRRLLIVGLGLLATGSVLGALAPDVGTLIVARTLQGASLGVLPLGISVLRDVLPASRVGTGVALMSSSLGIGAAGGLPLSGLVAQHASWRLLFGGLAVSAVLLGAAFARTVPELYGTGGRFDLTGAIGLATTLICLLLAISKGAEWGWSSTAVIGLLVASVAVLAAWIQWELRRPTPLVNLRISTRPAVLWTNVASTLVGFSMFTGFLMCTQLLQAPIATGYGFGLDMVMAGILLLPTGVAMTVFSPVSAQISRARGARATVLLGIVLLVVGNTGQALLPHTVLLVVVAATVSAAGGALAYSAIPIVIMNAVPMTETASSNSLNTLMRMLGTSSCSAFAAAVAGSLMTEVGGRLLPSTLAYTVAYGAAALAALAAGVAVAVAIPGGLRAQGVESTASEKSRAGAIPLEAPT